MPRRGASPTPSEGEVDILGSLYPGDGDGDNGTNGNDAGLDLDFDGLLNGPEPGNDDGDEAFIALQQAASFRKASNLKGRTVKKGGGFQAMGLNSNLLKAITRKGFSVPTPIQRKSIPLILDRKDLVGMARTGSGKTAAFVIPMIERLRAHSARFGTRALILSPSRELAIQTLKVVKEFGRGTDLKSVLLVGGDSLEEQFGYMAANPDIVIATPGRFLHLKVEMSLDLSSIQYVVFDEADRLFEMGFAAQLTEILHALPPSRQSLLFSATLPASLVEFARAGLQDPSLVRLDAETKVSPDLESAFFSVKGAEKEGSLLHILHDVIKMPVGLPEGAKEQQSEKGSKKRKRGPEGGSGKPTEHSTIIFTATKHHVEYLANLLIEAGFAVSYVYGSLDQVARRMQVEDFRRGKTNILVVTDVAARGIDIPVLANVINFDFPPQPKVFVHRVGRTARAGQRGWSYSLVRDTDAPYLLDLQLFLGKKLVVGQENTSPSFADDVVVGALKRDSVETHVEWFNKVLHENEDVSALRGVAGKAEKLYLKTRNSAASQSAKRARELVGTQGWTQLHPLFGEDVDGAEQARADMLARISGFRPQETIFEVGHRDKSTTEAAEVMKQLRKRITPRRREEKKDEEDDFDGLDDVPSGAQMDVDSDEEEEEEVDMEDDEEDSDDDLEVTVSNNNSKKGQTDWRDSEVFMSYTPRTFNAAEERGYGVQSGGQGSSFVEAARDVTMDLTNDESAKAFGAPTRAKMRWDKKSKKYVSRENDDDGSKGAKMIRGESGVKIAASFQSGRFDKWKRANRMGKLPHVGEVERTGGNTVAQLPSGPRYKHKQEKAPKEADKHRDDYRVRKKRVDEAREKRIGRFRDGMGSKKELKGRDDIRKARQEKERKRAKNARPSRRQ
ncbi:ATP-dependent RNA helicase DBP10 [Fusarium keratoplasticum]|uniref:ATP-dependent RNA helicase DBP10 n=1 Tax=Fusarium keratoplasticum TaxID=1328300 RepID=A0ACC0RAE7_9HYPO|nr:ATP-dependent RNA helicase DBP10 [Fusarium keratoplasticum]KAI8679773.1 ATP-dependent RNA helicase DBP10 [Fusarium keratoplasticum]KAI8685860.1 ATP-dependent RNA helicase DBP10 [Fusarium keratoplasticum]